MAMVTDTQASRLADQLERSFRGGAWHGPSLSEALEGIDGRRARLRPIPGAHTILELVGHVAFWLDACLDRLERGVDADSNGDWQVADDGSEASWRAALAALESAHRKLHAAVLALPEERLDDPVPGSDPNVRGMLLGLLQHNAYHAGQIALLARATEPGA
jgi:uncharacterized damage-inducible protein DinB